MFQESQTFPFMWGFRPFFSCVANLGRGMLQVLQEKYQQTRDENLGWPKPKKTQSVFCCYIFIVAGWYMAAPLCIRLISRRLLALFGMMITFLLHFQASDTEWKSRLVNSDLKFYSSRRCFDNFIAPFWSFISALPFIITIEKILPYGVTSWSVYLFIYFFWRAKI